MMRFLEELRKKPHSLRVLFAFWGAAMFALLVAGVWSLSLPSRMSNMMVLTEEAEVRPSGWIASVRGSFTGLQDLFVTAEEAEPAQTVTDDNNGPYEINLRTISTSSEPAPDQSTSETGVWARTYENKPGRTVLVATSSDDGGENDVLQ